MIYYDVILMIWNQLLLLINTFTYNTLIILFSWIILNQFFYQIFNFILIIFIFQTSLNIYQYIYYLIKLFTLFPVTLNQIQNPLRILLNFLKNSLNSIILNQILLKEHLLKLFFLFLILNLKQPQIKQQFGLIFPINIIKLLSTNHINSFNQLEILYLPFNRIVQQTILAKFSSSRKLTPSNIIPNRIMTNHTQ